MVERPVFQQFVLDADMRIAIAILLSIYIAGCAQNQQIIDTAVEQAASVNHAQYQVAELILCRGMSIGEWMRSIGPHPEKVSGWQALCVGTSLPSSPLPSKE